MNIDGVVCRSALIASLATSLVLIAARDSAAQSAPGAVEWINVVNATTSGSAIWKSGGCSGCNDAGSTSRQALTGADGYAEFTPVAGARFLAGLSSTTGASTDPASIDFAFSFWPDGGWDIRERAMYKGEGRFTTGDVFRVAVVNGVIKYYQNGAVVYSSAAPVTLPLVLDTTLVDTASGLSSAVITSTTTTPPTPSNPVSVVTTALPPGVVAQQYSTALTASGGSGSYNWTLRAGALPDGLGLASSGTISGTPRYAGTFSFTIRATDSSNATSYDDQALAIYVPVPASAVTVTTTHVASAHLNEPYSAVLSAQGGSGTFTWGLVSGALPAGVSLDATGALRGIPTVTGRFSVVVRAADAMDPAKAAEQALSLAVLAAIPPSSYDAITDRTPRAKPPVPSLGPAGYRFNDPLFGSRMMRVTDGLTRPGLVNRSYRTPSGTHTNAWSVDGRFFYATSTDGNLIPFAFDSATMSARRLDGSTAGDGGLTLRFFNEPTFSYVTPGVLYGTHNGAGANLRSVDQLDLESGVYSQLLNLDSLAPNLAGTYTGGLGSSAGPTEKLFAFFGGTSQDRHYYLVVFEKENPSNRLLLDTLTSTVNGVAANITLGFKIHAAAIDRSGRYVIVYPTGPDLQSPRYAAPAYVWDVVANLFTALPLVEARSGGHDAYGYGYRVNQDCCTSSTWDAAQWQFRSLAAPLATADLVTPVLLPKEIYLADHPSWHNAQPVALVPFIDATYRYVATATEWRAWDEEIIGVQTEAAGTGAIVWRFAHHRSNVAHDTEPSRYSFWYTPRANVSPDGRWALFTSNWDKTLGTDPGGEAGGTFRQDLFLVELKSAGTPPPPPPPSPVPVGVLTTSLPGAVQGQAYSTTLQAAGGSGTYSWSVVAGTLPSGLSLNASTGVISGTPASAGTATFTVRATDASDAANSDEQVLSVTVAAAPVGILTTSLPGAVQGQAYSTTLKAGGGSGTYSWSVVAGTLPSGLSLNASTGVISGTPASAGTVTFTVRATDASNAANSDEQVLSVIVAAAPVAPVTITTTWLPEGKRWAPYSATLSASGGRAPLTWTVASGSLPPGLALAATTGSIQGTPREAGTWTFVVRVVDSDSPATAATKSLSIRIRRR